MKERVTETCKQENERREKWRKILRVIKATIATIMTLVLFGIVIAEVTWCYIDTYYYKDFQYYTYNSSYPRDLTRIIVLVKEAYIEKLYAQEFTVEDFNWYNVEKIEYTYDQCFHSFKENIKKPLNIYVYLKYPGAKQIKQAIVYFNELYFVDVAYYYHRTWQW